MNNATNNTKLPLCIDCKHCVNSQDWLSKLLNCRVYSYSLSCKLTQKIEPDLHGYLLTHTQKDKTRIAMNNCNTERGSMGNCKEDGLLFETKN